MCRLGSFTRRVSAERCDHDVRRRRSLGRLVGPFIELLALGHEPQTRARIQANRTRIRHSHDGHQPQTRPRIQAPPAVHRPSQCVHQPQTRARIQAALVGSNINIGVHQPQTRARIQESHFLPDGALCVHQPQTRARIQGRLLQAQTLETFAAPSARKNRAFQRQNTPLPTAFFARFVSFPRASLFLR